MPTTPSPPRSGAGSEPARVPHGPTAPGAAAGTPARTRLAIPLWTILTGAAGSAMLALGGVGAGGVLVRDPLLSDSPLSWFRYGHGKDLATAVVFAGLGLLVLAWVRLGREVLARRVGGAGVIAAIGAWTLPLLVAPPLFTRDVYSYLAQGAIVVAGYDPYLVAPDVLSGPLLENVSWVWQSSPAPYGPLFVMLATAVAWVTGDSLIFGVILMRLVMVVSFVLVCWALPKLADRLGGRGPTALWLAAANPLVLVHLIGGPHNDLVMVGLLAVGVLLVLDRRPLLGIAVVTLAAAVKATAVIALPFLVWIWAARMEGSLRSRLLRAGSAGTAVFAAVFAACTLVAGVDLGWISALRNSSIVINWLSLPTLAGQLLHGMISWFAPVDRGMFLGIVRTGGLLLLVAFAVRQWWAARAGGPDAVRRAALVMLASAVLSPALFPWYLSWPLILAAGLLWAEWAIVVTVGASVWLLMVTFPDGTTALYSWGYLACALALSVLAAVSMVRPDPLRLSRRREPDPEPDPAEPRLDPPTDPVGAPASTTNSTP